MDPKELIEKTIRQPNLLTVKQRAELARHNLELIKENERYRIALEQLAEVDDAAHARRLARIALEFISP